MSATVTLPDELAAKLAREAERRHVTPDELAASVIADSFAAKPEVSQEAQAAMTAFLGMGASTSGRRAADVEDWLAEEFRR